MSTISVGLAATIREWFNDAGNAKELNTNVHSEKLTSNPINDIEALLKSIGYNSVQDIKVAAEQGDVSAQYHLGMMYKKGLGVPKDHEEASKWISKAKKQLSKKSTQTRKCKHCDNIIKSTICEKGCHIENECLDCHNEIQHNIIKNGNIHIAGGHGSSRSGTQEDWSDSFDDMGSDFWENHYSKFAKE